MEFKIMREGRTDHVFLHHWTNDDVSSWNFGEQPWLCLTEKKDIVDIDIVVSDIDMVDGEWAQFEVGYSFLTMIKNWADAFLDVELLEDYQEDRNIIKNVDELKAMFEKKKDKPFDEDTINFISRRKDKMISILEKAIEEIKTYDINS